VETKTNNMARTEKDVQESIENYNRLNRKDIKDIANWVRFFGVITVLGIIAAAVLASM